MLKFIVVTTLFAVPVFGFWTPEMIRNTFPVSSEKMLGGDVVPIDDVPWAVSILFTKYLHEDIRNFAGAGSIIGDKWVLTSAHVVCDKYSKSLKVKQVSVGSKHYYNGQKYNISRIYCHEDYEYFADSDTTKNDIALLKVNGTFNINLLQIQIYYELNEERLQYENKVGSISGWGSMRSDGYGISTNLKKIDMRIWSKSQCDEFLGIVYASSKTSPDRFCAKGINNGFLCYGDSGSGLTIGHQLVGISSWILGDRCDTASPAVFTNVSYFQPWIKRIINEPSQSELPHRELV